MKATNELIQEHEGIEIMLRVLLALSEKFEKGERIPVEHTDGILEFLTTFVDKCHHGKEEEFLLPALQAAGFTRYAPPCGDVLREHEQGRILMSRFKDGLEKYNAGDRTSAACISRTISNYVSLLTRHIARENAVLFPLAEDKLEAAKDSELVGSFEKLEQDRIGPGKHQEFHAFLERLRDTYLV